MIIFAVYERGGSWDPDVLDKLFARRQAAETYILSFPVFGGSGVTTQSDLEIREHEVEE